MKLNHATWALAGMLALQSIHPVLAEDTLTPDEARAIAKEAYIYGYPIVDGYRIQHAFFVNGASPQFKAPWNKLFSAAQVFTSADRVVQTPNSDTPYSLLGADLRSEPLVLTVPPIESERYFSLAIIDAYTFATGFIGTRSTGNKGGDFLLAGPNWKGGKPEGIEGVISTETELAIVIYRTQLFSPEDIDNVRKIQSGYKVQTLSEFLGKPAPTAASTVSLPDGPFHSQFHGKPTPAAAPAIDFIAPLTPEQQRTSPEFYRILNFVLQFCPTHPSEKELMARFARLGVGAGQTFDADKLPPEIRKAVEDGMADAWKEFNELQRTRIDTDELTSADMFGSREFLNNNFLYRMAGAVVGIYGLPKEEAIYPTFFKDSTGQPLKGDARYALRFPPGQLPPVNAFWSVTMYDLPDRFLVANPLNRYLINSPMLPSLKRDADGGLTLHLQHESPGEGKESNWLPAPSGPFFLALRLYLPQPAAFDGTWKRPQLERQPD